MGYHEDCPECGGQLPDTVSTSDGPCTYCLKAKLKATEAVVEAGRRAFEKLRHSLQAYTGDNPHKMKLDRMQMLEVVEAALSTLDKNNKSNGVNVFESKKADKNDGLYQAPNGFQKDLDEVEKEICSGCDKGDCEEKKS